MDFTKKIKSFVSSKQGSRSPIEIPVSTAIEANENLLIPDHESPQLIHNDPMVDRQILDSIETVYYSDDFDPSDYELRNLPETPDITKIDNDHARLTSQLAVVSAKLSDLILQNQSALADELQRVTDLQKSLEESCTICVKSRGYLAQTKQDFTIASLGILASYCKREQLKNLLRSLNLIKTLQETDMRLRELLEEQDYPGAIQLCLECQKAASTFKHYKCISELSSKLQDTLEMTEEQLDVALSKVCTKFDKINYEKLQSAYSLLGKTQTAMDQLLMHFTSAIRNTAFTVILQHVESSFADKNLHKIPYFELCKHISSEKFTACLVNLCEALWKIMYSYWCILNWHETVENFNPTLNDEDMSCSQESMLNKNYVKQKLEHGLIRVWQDVQQKVKAYLLASDLSSFKFNEFIHVLALIQRLMDVGEDFCGSLSEDLQESLRKQSVNYFRNYHRGFMEELRAFLENESWELCPVHSAFSAIHLQEFHFFKQSTEQVQENSKNQRRCNSFVRHKNFFKKHPECINPFEEKFEDNIQEDVLAPRAQDTNETASYESDSSDSDVAEELKKDFIDEHTGDVPTTVISKLTKKTSYTSRKRQIPILTNTALSVLRSFGKYMQMMSVLKPIAFDVLICMSQLFDYYMYSVYSFFAKEMCDLSQTIVSNKLKTTLKRIRENLVCEERDLDNFENKNREKVPSPTLSSLVNLSSSGNLYGLAERVAAAESLVFLAEQFQSLHSHLETLIPPARIAFLQQFCSQTISQASELRRPIYMTVAAKAIDYEQIVNLMSNVKWDINEIMSQHSTYVDILLREQQVFSMQLSEISKTVPVPKEAYDLLWEHCIKLSNHSFIEGFSQAKKCTNGGRALMQLDYQQFLSKVEHLTDLRPIPGKDVVESYVKAYYLLEPSLEQWIRTHKDYTSKQLVGLVSCITQVNKKGRQKLLALIEETERIKK